MAIAISLFLTLEEKVAEETIVTNPFWVRGKTVSRASRDQHADGGRAYIGRNKKTRDGVRASVKSHGTVCEPRTCRIWTDETGTRHRWPPCAFRSRKSRVDWSSFLKRALATNTERSLNSLLRASVSLFHWLSAGNQAMAFQFSRRRFRLCNSM